MNLGWMTDGTIPPIIKFVLISIMLIALWELNKFRVEVKNAEEKNEN